MSAILLLTISVPQSASALIGGDAINRTWNALGGLGLNVRGTFSGYTLNGTGLKSCTNLQTSIAGLLSCNNAQYLPTSTGSLKTFFDALYLRTSTGSLKNNFQNFFDGKYLNSSTGSLAANFNGLYLRTSTGALKANFFPQLLVSSTGSLKTNFQTFFDGKYLASSTGSLKALFDTLYFRTSTGSLKNNFQTFFDGKYLASSTGALKTNFGLQFVQSSTGAIKAVFFPQLLVSSTGSLKANFQTFFDGKHLNSSTGSLKTAFDALYLRTSTGSLKALFDTLYFRTSTGSLRAGLFGFGQGLSKTAAGIVTLNSSNSGSLSNYSTYSGYTFRVKTTLLDSGSLVVKSTSLLQGALKVLANISGSSLNVTGYSNMSGALSVQGATMFKTNVNTQGALSGTSLVVNGTSMAIGRHTFTFPTAQGANNQVLVNNGSDTLSWATQAGNTVTGIGQGLTVTSGLLTLSTSNSGSLANYSTLSGSTVFAKIILRSSGSLSVFKSGNFQSGSLTVTRKVGYSTGSLLVVDAKGLVYDGTNKRVGINKVSPATALDVSGTISGVSLFTRSEFLTASTVTGALVLTTPDMTSAGNTDSPYLLFRTKGNDGTSHSENYRIFDNATANNADGQLEFAHALDTGTYTTDLTLDDNGQITTTNDIGMPSGKTYYMNGFDNNWGIDRNANHVSTKQLVSGNNVEITANDDANGGFVIGKNSGKSYFEILANANSPKTYVRYQLSVSGSMVVGVNAGSTAPKATLEVQGDASGRTLHLNVGAGAGRPLCQQTGGLISYCQAAFLNGGCACK